MDGAPPTSKEVTARALFAVRTGLHKAVPSYRLLKGCYLVDAIYYPSSQIKDQKAVMFDAMSDIPSRLTHQDLFRMSAFDMTISADDEFPHGIISDDCTYMVQKPPSSGLPLLRYKNQVTGNHHIIWMAPVADSQSILAGKKSCVSVAHRSVVQRKKGDANITLQSCIDHVALLDPTKTPPAFEECQVKAVLPVVPQTLAEQIITGAKYHSAAIARTLEPVANSPAPSALSSGISSGASLPAGADASLTAKQWQMASTTENQPQQATDPMDTTPDVQEPNRFSIPGLVEMINSGKKEDVSTALQNMETIFTNGGISNTATTKEIHAAVAANKEIPAEDAGDVVTSLLAVQKLYNEMKSATIAEEEKEKAANAAKEEEKKPQQYTMENLLAGKMKEISELSNEIKTLNPSSSFDPDVFTQFMGECKNPALQFAGCEAVKEVMAYSIKASKKRKNMTAAKKVISKRGDLSSFASSSGSFSSKPSASEPMMAAKKKSNEEIMKMLSGL